MLVSRLITWSELGNFSESGTAQSKERVANFFEKNSWSNMAFNSFKTLNDLVKKQMLKPFNQVLNLVRTCFPFLGQGNSLIAVNFVRLHVCLLNSE